jgi:hypothetical protein
MSAFQEDFLQTVVNVNWPSTTVEFSIFQQFALNPRAIGVIAGGPTILVPLIQSQAVLTKKYPQSFFNPTKSGLGSITWTLLVDGPPPISIPTGFISATMRHGASTFPASISATFNPSQGPPAPIPFTSDRLLIDFKNHTMQWQF